MSLGGAVPETSGEIANQKDGTTSDMQRELPILCRFLVLKEF